MLTYEKKIFSMWSRRIHWRPPVNHLMMQGHEVVRADVKPKEFWFQLFDKNENFSLDLKEYENCLKVSKGVNFVTIWLATWEVWDLLRTTKQNVCYLF